MPHWPASLSTANLKLQAGLFFFFFFLKSPAWVWSVGPLIKPLLRDHRVISDIYLTSGKKKKKKKKKEEEGDSGLVVKLNGV